jgi:cation:H+ antiporter
LGLASGTLIGSTIINFILVFPSAILLGESIRVGTTKTQKNGIILILGTLLFILMQKINIPSIVKGIVLILGLVGANYLEYAWGVMGRVQEDKKLIDIIFKKEKVTPDLIFGLLFSLVGVTVGGLLVVNGIEGFASISGYSTTVLGLTITGIATSLPDVFTSVTSQKNDEDKLTLGHIMGGSLYNLLFIGGIVEIVGGNPGINNFEAIFLVVCVLLFFIIIKFYKGKDIPKWVGIALLILFFVYMYLLSFNARVGS